MLKSMKIHKNQKAIVITLQILFIMLTILNMQTEYNKLYSIYNETYMKKIIYLQAYSIINNIKLNIRNSIERLTYTNSSTEIREKFLAFITSTINFYNNSLIDNTDHIIITIPSTTINIIINNSVVKIIYEIIIEVYDTLGSVFLTTSLEDELIFIPR